MKTDFINDLISEIHSDFTTDMYYFSIITSKSFFLYTRFYTKKEKRGSLESPLHQRCIKSCILDNQTKKEKSLPIQGFYKNLATDNNVLCKLAMNRIYNFIVVF